MMRGLSIGETTIGEMPAINLCRHSDEKGNDYYTVKRPSKERFWLFQRSTSAREEFFPAWLIDKAMAVVLICESISELASAFSAKEREQNKPDTSVEA